MPLYQIKVNETVVQEKLYTVQADTPEDAIEMAQHGETEAEELLRDVMVTNREVTGNPAELNEQPPQP